MDTLSPIQLGSTMAAIGNTNGSTMAVNPTELMNPNRTPMLIDSIRVAVSPSDGALADPNQFPSMLGNISLGNAPLTNSFIPLVSFMPPYRSYLGDLTRSWHFARPLYVPPDVQFNIVLKRQAPTAWTYESNIKWGVSLMGRSMPAGMPIPDEMYLPWACATTIYKPTLPFISPTNAIGNPNNDPLEVDYFCGFNTVADSIANRIQPMPLTVQMTLSSGKVIARDPIPFFALFPAVRPILRARARLQPQEFVSVVVDMPTTPTVVAKYMSPVFTTIGMTGYRRINTPKGAQP